jgi:RNA polymerase sigma-70 factor (ECF subfamily)
MLCLMPEVLEAQLTTMRGELVGFAYRMLGSPFEAEDAAQEALLRAWRHGDDFDPARASLRTWVYRILTNVCLDMVRSAQRRALTTDFTSSAAPGGDLGPPLPSSRWVLPLLGDPSAEAERRESIRLAFVAALQHLPPRQRAVLILRDVLCWQADEVAALLDTSTASVTSALQRARATLRTAAPPRPTSLSEDAQRSLVDRYADAFQRHDIATLVTLLQQDVTTSMPPFAWWLRGRDQVATVMSSSDECLNDRMLPAWANGAPALWQHRPARPDGPPEPFALLVFDFGDELISGVTTFLGFREVRGG